jgi:hypothetical protein
MANENEKRAILIGGCFTLFIAVMVAIIFIIASLL